MRRMFTSLILCAAMLSLAGCGDPTYEDMLADKALLQETLDDCKEQGMAAYDQQVCKDAQRAAMKVTMDAVSEAMGGALEEAMKKAQEDLDK